MFHNEMVVKYSLLHLPDDWVYKKCGKKSKKVYGVGINDVEFATEITVNGKKIIHPAYEHWRGLIRRSFDQASKAKNKTYSEVTCCDEWCYFSGFLSWWKSHYTIGYSLDKDIIVRGNKVYSPETCVFVPKTINSFLTTSMATRGDYPLGVSLSGNKYIAKTHRAENKAYLGSYESIEQAHKAWQLAKIHECRLLIEKYNLDELNLVVQRLLSDYENNLITQTI